MIITTVLSVSLFDSCVTFVRPAAALSVLGVFGISTRLAIRILRALDADPASTRGRREILRRTIIISKGLDFFFAGGWFRMGCVLLQEIA